MFHMYTVCLTVVALTPLLFERSFRPGMALFLPPRLAIVGTLPRNYVLRIKVWVTFWLCLCVH